ncbi:hypothetical protein ACJO17_24480 [Vibrio parahaemolyticus]|uniref:hypothetical protein n=1 Tax=Vibrio parahaemolyticus TaxID=670 RepID=UPI00387ACBC6
MSNSLSKKVNIRGPNNYQFLKWILDANDNFLALNHCNDPDGFRTTSKAIQSQLNKIDETDVQKIRSTFMQLLVFFPESRVDKFVGLFHAAKSRDKTSTTTMALSKLTKKRFDSLCKRVAKYSTNDEFLNLLLDLAETEYGLDESNMR